MTENRDFLKEFEELRVETNEIRDALVSKTAHLNSSIMNSGIFEEIVRELRQIRRENKENQEKNDKKFEEIQKKMENNEKKTEEKFSETVGICKEMTTNQQKNEKIMDEMRKELAEIKENFDRKEAMLTKKTFVGKWKMVQHENFEGSKKAYTFLSLESFSKNLKFELINGKLKRSGAGYADMTESEGNGWKDLCVEGDHLKSFWASGNTDDYHIENEKLNYVQTVDGEVWKRIYEKI